MNYKRVTIVMLVKDDGDGYLLHDEVCDLLRNHYLDDDEDVLSVSVEDTDEDETENDDETIPF